MEVHSQVKKKTNIIAHCTKGDGKGIHIGVTKDNEQSPLNLPKQIGKWKRAVSERLLMWNKKNLNWFLNCGY